MSDPSTQPRALQGRVPLSVGVAAEPLAPRLTRSSASSSSVPAQASIWAGKPAPRRCVVGDPRLGGGGKGRCGTPTAPSPPVLPGSSQPHSRGVAWGTTGPLGPTSQPLEGSESCPAPLLRPPQHPPGSPSPTPPLPALGGPRGCPSPPSQAPEGSETPPQPQPTLPRGAPSAPSPIPRHPQRPQPPYQPHRAAQARPPPDPGPGSPGGHSPAPAPQTPTAPPRLASTPRLAPPAWLLPSLLPGSGLRPLTPRRGRRHCPVQAPPRAPFKSPPQPISARRRPRGARRES